MAFITKSSNLGVKAVLCQERAGWFMFTNNSDILDYIKWKFGSPDSITRKGEMWTMSLNHVLIRQHPLVRINL